jgi:hypothetical protein
LLNAGFVVGRYIVAIDHRVLFWCEIRYASALRRI